MHLALKDLETITMRLPKMQPFLQKKYQGRTKQPFQVLDM